MYYFYLFEALNGFHFNFVFICLLSLCELISAILCSRFLLRLLRHLDCPKESIRRSLVLSYELKDTLIRSMCAVVKNYKNII